jgi:hypothetical protein
MRLIVEENGADPVARLARLIPNFVQVGQSASEQAAWFMAADPCTKADAVA